MAHKLSKRKRATKGRTAAPRRPSKRRTKAADPAEVALATLLALLHADRWLFEASELAKNGGLGTEIEAFNSIRLAIVESLNRLQPQAYGAMTRAGQ
jgi:hypothetical protein